MEPVQAGPTSFRPKTPPRANAAIHPDQNERAYFDQVVESTSSIQYLISNGGRKSTKTQINTRARYSADAPKRNEDEEFTLNDC